MKVHSLVLTSISCIIFFLAIGCACFGIQIPGYCTLSSFEGKVIDAETKQPIQGAVVLAVYYGSVSSVAGSMSYIVDAQETLTNANGEFMLPEVKYWSSENPGKPRGTLNIFKPGYGTLQHTQALAVGENKTWPAPEKYVVYEIPKLETVKERKENVRFIGRYSEIPYSKKKHYWKEVNKERYNVGLPVMTMTDKERQK